MPFQDGENVFMAVTHETLNDILNGRTIQSVEKGIGSGEYDWIVLHLSQKENEDGVHTLLTIRIDDESDPHPWSAAVHHIAKDGIRWKYPIRPLPN
jgi:hypothetical protein